MGESVDEYRARVLNRHLICEALVNNFITNYFFGSISFSTVFKNLVLDSLMFRRKINILETIFDNRMYNEQIRSQYSNLKIEKGRIVSVKKKNGEELTTAKLIKKLELINTIRNHLVHNLVMDSSTIKKVFPDYRKRIITDMNYRGDKVKFENADNYILEFFFTLAHKKLKVSKK